MDTTKHTSAPHPISKHKEIMEVWKPNVSAIAKVLTLMAENIGGTCQISPQKDEEFFFMSSSLICSHGSR